MGRCENIELRRGHSLNHRSDANEFAVYKRRICQSLALIHRWHLVVVSHHRVRVRRVSGRWNAFGVEFCQCLEVGENIGKLPSHRLHFVFADTQCSEARNVPDIFG